MAKLRLTYPVIIFHTLDVEVGDERAEEVLKMNLRDKAEFIEKQNEKHNGWYLLPELKNMEAALNNDYASIKRLPDATHKSTK